MAPSFSPVNPMTISHTAYVAPDGRHLAFTSTASLTGRDNLDANNGKADAEVFLYGAEEENLSCISCNRSGARPSGGMVRAPQNNASLPVAAMLPPGQTFLHAPHVLADDGSRVFFVGFDPLVLADTNGAADVYQWEAPGSGGCSVTSPSYSAANEGCVDLLSDGKSPVDSALLDASATGDDVFFATEASLLDSDPGQTDIYDARVGGGFAEPSPPPVPCEGEACSWLTDESSVGQRRQCFLSRPRKRQGAPPLPPMPEGQAQGETQGRRAVRKETSERAREAIHWAGRAGTMRQWLKALLVVVSVSLVVVAPAQADFGFKALDVSFAEADGSMADQAGRHPFAMTTVITLNHHIDPEDGEVPDGELKDLEVELPVGFAGDPKATPRCSNAQFLEFLSGSEAYCPNSTVVGFATYSIFAPGNAETVPVYNLVPAHGAAAKLGFVAAVEPVTIEVGLRRSEPYNVSAMLMNIPQAVPFFGSTLTLWGNPADPLHDALRGTCLTIKGGSQGSCPTGAPPRPFITMPRSCEGPLATKFRADSWQQPGVFVEGTATTHDNSAPPQPRGMGGCANLEFGPDIDARPTTAMAESPSGLDFSLEVDDQGLTDPDGTADSDIRDIVVSLPPGVTVNPSAAEGQGACGPAEYAAEDLDTPPGIGCPSASKLGTVEVETPLLEGEPLHGALYLATPDDPTKSGHENPFDSLVALYLVIRKPELGIAVKQAGKVELQPDGQIVSSFEDIPQVPLNRVELHLRSGSRAPLVTPAACGTYTTAARLVPWSGTPPTSASSNFAIAAGPGGSPCPPPGAPPFSPGFEGGTVDNAAGSYSPTYLRLTRADGEQEMTRFSATFPAGLVGKIAGLDRCSDPALLAASVKSGLSELSSPSCPIGSRIGSVLAGAGVGQALTYVPGSLYLAGPYNGSALSVAAVTPAVAGPFDLGTVVVRVGLDLNPLTAEVEVVGAASDPIPRILAGIPLRLRDLRIETDRPQFTLNPTGCEEKSFRGTLFGGVADAFNVGDDTPVSVAERFQAADCASLGFTPKLSLALTGGTRRSANTALRAILKPRPGDANLEGAEVTLPSSQFIDNSHINNPCTRVQFNAGTCPPGSVLGHARAFTPLLNEPLEGPVYFRSNGGERSLPDLVVALGGQFRFHLVIGILHARNGRVRTKVLNAPDAPVSRFVLRMAGGKRGLLENSEDLCRAKQRVNLNLTGQNGRRYKTAPVIKTSCKGNSLRRDG